jgi:hypothetical protein
MLLLVAAASGCLNQGGGLASSTLPITERDVYTVMGPASGSDGTLVIWGFPILPVSGHGAIQDAKRKTGADMLIDVTAENQMFFYGLPISYHRIKVSGMAAKFQRGTAN